MPYTHVQDAVDRSTIEVDRSGYWWCQAIICPRCTAKVCIGEGGYPHGCWRCGITMMPDPRGRHIHVKAGYERPAGFAPRPMLEVSR